ncbi:MAG: rod shape-determining protein [Candidatus Thiodiazotropha endolucinida]
MRAFDQLVEKYSNIFYVQIWEQKLKVTDASTGRIYEDIPLVAIQTMANGRKEVSAIGSEAKMATGANILTVNPFSHPRVLFSDFTVAEKLLQHVFRLLNKGKLFTLNPTVVVHPMEKTEGGLTMIENRAFKELGTGAGAREVFVYEGNPIPVQELSRSRLLASDEEPQSQRGTENMTTTIVSLLLFVLVIMFMAFIGSQNGN